MFEIAAGAFQNFGERLKDLADFTFAVTRVHSVEPRDKDNFPAVYLRDATENFCRARPRRCEEHDRLAVVRGIGFARGDEFNFDWRIGCRTNPFDENSWWSNATIEIHDGFANDRSLGHGLEEGFKLYDIGLGKAQVAKRRHQFAERDSRGIRQAVCVSHSRNVNNGSSRG